MYIKVLMNLIEFIKKTPKAELHLHIEGTLEPSQMFDLAKRNNIRIPFESCLLYTSPSPRDGLLSRMPSSA